MRTVLYARFSNEELQNSRSSADQLAMLRERADREGWTVVGVFSDDGISGAAGLEARPGLTAALDMIELREAEQLLAESTDRIARHQGDAFAVRERIEFAGARLFTLFDGVVDDITGTIKGLFDARFRKDLGQRIKRGQRGAVSDGRSPAGLAYGYRKANRLDAAGNLIRGLREIDPDQAAIVVRIFEEYAADISPRAIAERLNREGVPGPHGRQWRASTIYGNHQRQDGMLQNRLYAGELVLGRTSKVTDPRTRRVRIRPNPESDWIRRPMPELRIVGEDLWNRVADRRARAEGRPWRAQRRPKRMLSGLAFCGTCGGAWTVVGLDRWGCATRRNGGICSNSRTIGTQWLEERVLRGLTERLLDPRLVTIWVREYHLEHARNAAESGKGRARLERRLADASARVDRLVAAIAAGGGEFEEIRQALAAARSSRDQLAAELAELEAFPVVALHPGIADQYRAQVEALGKGLADPESREAATPMIRALIDRVTVTPGERPRTVEIDVDGRLTSLIALAAGKPAADRLMFEVERVKGTRHKHNWLRARV